LDFSSRLGLLGFQHRIEKSDARRHIKDMTFRVFMLMATESLAAVCFSVAAMSDDWANVTL
jgi:hypothetical protein